MRINPIFVKTQIELLLLAYPELAEDEILRADVFEAETDLFKLLGKIEEIRANSAELAEAVAATIAKRQGRKARFEERERRMRELMMAVMAQARLSKAELPEATISVRMGTPKVIITDENDLPDEFCRFKREPDKAKIKEALTGGASISGAVMSNAEPGLTIRQR